MSKGNTFENDLLLLIFNNTNIANLGDATGIRGSSAAGSLYLALHTTDPGEAGDQPRHGHDRGDGRHRRHEKSDRHQERHIPLTLEVLPNQKQLAKE